MMVHDLSVGMHWIGHPGSLVPIIDFGSEESSDDIDLKVGTSLGGGRRVRRSRNRALRSWSLTIPAAHADQLEPLRTLATATYGPYQLVTANAQVSNVLTPERSTMQSVMQGAVALAGGWPIADSGGKWTTLTGLNSAAAGGSMGQVRVGPCPAPPLRTQRPVTVSALLATSRSAGARVVLEWLDPAGSQVSGVVGNSVTGMDALRRSSVTATPPWGAVSCRIGVLYAEVIAQPQVTWTSSVIPEWTVGNGADSVEIASLSSSTDMAVPDDYGLRRSDYSVSLIESGPLS